MEYKIDKSKKIWNKDQYMRHYQTLLGFNVQQIEIMWTNLSPIEISSYDSSKDTLEHIKHVNTFLINSSEELLDRAKVHDNSKLSGLEKELFDKYTPILKTITYGSDDYKKSLEMLKPALDNHYKENTHHPEHYENGINDMDLFDILEMLNDWKAATKRTKTGDIKKSLEINKDRFNISDQLYDILLNTIERYDWLTN